MEIVIANASTIGVLGLGSIGLRHAGNAIDLGCRVVGFDPSMERRAMLTDIGGEARDSKHAVIEDAGAVAICTPNGMHLDDMRLAVAARRHVFVEKPLAHVADGVDDVLRTAAANGTVVFAALNQRLNPAVCEARSMLRDGQLGTILWAQLLAASYLPEWRPGQDYRSNYAADPLSGGVIFDVVHEFDLAHFLLGPATTVASVARSTGTLDLGAEDCADIILRHEGGVTSTLHIDYVTRPPRRRIEIAGTDGLLSVDVRNRRLVLRDRDDRVVREEAWSRTVADDYREEMKLFVDCVDGKAAPLCDGEEALAVLRLVLAARELSGLPSA